MFPSVSRLSQQRRSSLTGKQRGGSGGIALNFNILEDHAWPAADTAHSQTTAPITSTGQNWLQEVKELLLYAGRTEEPACLHLSGLSSQWLQRDEFNTRPVRLILLRVVNALLQKDVLALQQCLPDDFLFEVAHLALSLWLGSIKSTRNTRQTKSERHEPHARGECHDVQSMVCFRGGSNDASGKDELPVTAPQHVAAAPNSFPSSPRHRRLADDAGAQADYRRKRQLAAHEAANADDAENNTKQQPTGNATTDGGKFSFFRHNKSGPTIPAPVLSLFSLRELEWALAAVESLTSGSKGKNQTDTPNQTSASSNTTSPDLLPVELHSLVSYASKWLLLRALANVQLIIEARTDDVADKLQETEADKQEKKEETPSAHARKIQQQQQQQHRIPPYLKSLLDLPSPMHVVPMSYAPRHQVIESLFQQRHERLIESLAVLAVSLQEVLLAAPKTVSRLVSDGNKRVPLPQIRAQAHQVCLHSIDSLSREIERLGKPSLGGDPWHWKSEVLRRMSSSSFLIEFGETYLFTCEEVLVGSLHRLQERLPSVETLERNEENFNQAEEAYASIDDILATNLRLREDLLNQLEHLRDGIAMKNKELEELRKQLERLVSNSCSLLTPSAPCLDCLSCLRLEKNGTSSAKQPRVWPLCCPPITQHAMLLNPSIKQLYMN